jgi:hypothetical protein
MKKLWQAGLVSLSFTLPFPAAAQTIAHCPHCPSAPLRIPTEVSVAIRATGTFDVKLAPQTTAHPADSSVGRMSIDKQYHGDLEGTGEGEMLASMSSTKGSAGYVALEKVTGTLKGKKGTFVLQHTATMNRGAGTLSITVVPDSGTGELQGITGTMNIVIADGKHSYEFDYTLP